MRHVLSSCFIYIYLSIYNTSRITRSHNFLLHHTLRFVWQLSWRHAPPPPPPSLSPSLCLSLSLSQSVSQSVREPSAAVRLPHHTRGASEGAVTKERLRGFIDPERSGHLDLTIAACFFFLLLFIYYFNSVDFLGLRKPHLPNHVWGSGGCEQAYRKHIQGERKETIDG